MLHIWWNRSTLYNLSRDCHHNGQFHWRGPYMQTCLPALPFNNMLDVYSSGILKKSENSTLLRWSSIFGNPRAKDMDFRLLAFQIFPMIRWGTGSDLPYPKHLPNTKNPVRAYSRCHAPFLHPFLAPPTTPKVRTN